MSQDQRELDGKPEGNGVPEGLRGSVLGPAKTAQERAEEAASRDQAARTRDRVAEERDRAAKARDQASKRFEQGTSSGRRVSELQATVKHAADERAKAAADRARAAADRKQAAADREQAAIDRHHALTELRRTHVDELTGAYRRDVGLAVLDQVIDRARRSAEQLVLAFVDVDRLKEVNGREGHLGGDELLREVVGAIRSSMRSYEPLVRFGGDEFICSFGGVDIEEARRCFDEIQGDLRKRGVDGSVSVGLAALRPEDDLTDLIERADAALIETQRHH